MAVGMFPKSFAFDCNVQCINHLNAYCQHQISIMGGSFHQ